MRKSIFLITTMNATCLGKTNTNDSYFRINNKEFAKVFFPILPENKKLAFNVQEEDGSICAYEYKLTSNNEDRITRKSEGINGGSIDAKLNMKPGDIMCFEKNNEELYFLHIQRMKNILFLTMRAEGCFIDRNDFDYDQDFLVQNHSLQYNEKTFNIRFKYLNQRGRRSETARQLFSFYEILNNEEICTNFKDEKYLILDFNQNIIKKIEPQKMIIINS